VIKEKRVRAAGNRASSPPWTLKVYPLQNGGEKKKEIQGREEEKLTTKKKPFICNLPIKRGAALDLKPISGSTYARDEVHKKTEKENQEALIKGGGG